MWRKTMPDDDDDEEWIEERRRLTMICGDDVVRSSWRSNWSDDKFGIE